MAAFEAAPIFLLLYSATAIPATSATSKYLLLVKVITNNIHANKMAGKLQADPEKCAGKGSITAQMIWTVEFVRLLFVVW
jgi:hypothetical protein